MTVGSYKQHVSDVEFTPYSFQGHGWLYSHEPESEEQENLLLAAGAFEIKAQKKNTGTVLFKSGASQPPPRKKRGCCGR
tara:strand:- start:86 stop:322 length:237 start_codon:yes stop_codon:yes gene_type:complete